MYEKLVRKPLVYLAPRFKKLFLPFYFDLIHQIDLCIELERNTKFRPGLWELDSDGSKSFFSLALWRRESFVLI